MSSTFITSNAFELLAPLLAVISNVYSACSSRSNDILVLTIPGETHYMLTKLQCFKNSEEERLYLMRGTLITGDAVVYVMAKFRVECLLKNGPLEKKASD